MRILLSILLAACSSVQEIAHFTPGQVSEDIRYLQDKLQKFHPGIYRYTQKDSMDLYFEQAANSVKGLDSLQLYARVTGLLSKIGCGHTRSRMSNELRASLESGQIFLPFTIKILDGKYFIFQTLEDGLNPGDQLLAINGLTIDQIEEKIFSHISADGWIETGKARMTELLFDLYYQLYISPGTSEYSIQINRVGNNLSFQLAGSSYEAMSVIRNTFPDEDYLSLEVSDNVAHMRIRTFSESALINNGWDYTLFLEESFRELQKSDVQYLILDLRGNGGGKDDFGALLVSYLARETYGYFDRIEVTKDYPGRSEKIGNQYRWTAHNGLSVWQPNEIAFTGNVYVLIDGFSFSTCADVATVLHHQKWATFLGEETGGGYDGNTSGHTKAITLPNSKTIVNIPMWKYTTANVGHKFYGRGVIPDYSIAPSWDEFHAGTDVVLEKARELITKEIE